MQSFPKSLHYQHCGRRGARHGAGSGRWGRAAPAAPPGAPPRPLRVSGPGAHTQPWGGGLTPSRSSHAARGAHPARGGPAPGAHRSVHGAPGSGSGLSRPDGSGRGQPGAGRGVEPCRVPGSPSGSAWGTVGRAGQPSAVLPVGAERVAADESCGGPGPAPALRSPEGTAATPRPCGPLNAAPPRAPAAKALFSLPAPRQMYMFLSPSKFPRSSTGESLEKLIPPWQLLASGASERHL